MGQKVLRLWGLKKKKTLGGTKDTKRLVIEVKSKNKNITFHFKFPGWLWKWELSDVENSVKTRPLACESSHNMSIFLRPSYPTNPLYNDQDETSLKAIEMSNMT